jgi:hypothetical protein
VSYVLELKWRKNGEEEMVEIDMEDEGGRREMGGRRNNTRRAIYQKYSFNNVCSVV